MTQKPSCCGAPKSDSDHQHNHSKNKIDVIYASSLTIILGAVSAHYALNFFTANSPQILHHFAMACIELLSSMWWGIALGIVIIGLMSKIPRELFTAALGQSNSFGGLLRAVFAGVFLDLCCHGILLVASKLYERGVSLAQVIAFLIASPWNSLSLTLILVSLIGIQWTLLYIAGSVVIALISGIIFQHLTKKGILPENPNKHDIPDNYSFSKEFSALLKSVRISRKGIQSILSAGWHDGQMIIKWLLFGTVLAASVRTFIHHDLFADLFAPTILGLLLTVLIASIIEICSEGSAPLAGELFNTAAAPGNGFAFLMAGVATDYTEFLIIREFTKSWKIAIFLPLVTVPQIMLLGYIMNLAS